MDLSFRIPSGRSYSGTAITVRYADRQTPHKGTQKMRLIPFLGSIVHGVVKFKVFVGLLGWEILPESSFNQIPFEGRSGM
jgi:hypothetical protein